MHKRLPRSRWASWVLSGLSLLIVCALGMLVVTQPAVAALGCPECFGFEHVAGRIYVDPGMANETRAMLLRADADATRRIAPFLGGTSTNPVIIACSDEDCQRRIKGGGVRGMSYASYGLRLSPRGLDPATVAHERTLIELQHRVGLVGFMRGAIPEWFMEGVAVVVSGNPRDLNRPGFPGGDLVCVTRRSACPQARRSRRFRPRPAGRCQWVRAGGGC